MNQKKLREINTRLEGASAHGYVTNVEISYILDAILEPEAEPVVGRYWVKEKNGNPPDYEVRGEPAAGGEPALDCITVWRNVPNAEQLANQICALLNATPSPVAETSEKVQRVVDAAMAAHSRTLRPASKH